MSNPFFGSRIRWAMSVLRSTQSQDLDRAERRCVQCHAAKDIHLVNGRWFCKSYQGCVGRQVEQSDRAIARETSNQESQHD